MKKNSGVDDCVPRVIGSANEDVEAAKTKHKSKPNDNTIFEKNALDDSIVFPPFPTRKSYEYEPGFQVLQIYGLTNQV